MLPLKWDLVNFKEVSLPGSQNDEGIALLSLLKSLSLKSISNNLVGWVIQVLLEWHMQKQTQSFIKIWY